MPESLVREEGGSEKKRMQGIFMTMFEASLSQTAGSNFVDPSWGNFFRKGTNMDVSIRRREELLFLGLNYGKNFSGFELFVSKRARSVRQGHDNLFSEFLSCKEFAGMQPDRRSAFLYESEEGERYIKILDVGFVSIVNSQREELDSLLSRYNISRVFYIEVRPHPEDVTFETRRTYPPLETNNALGEVVLKQDQEYREQIWAEIIRIGGDALGETRDRLNVFQRVMAELGREPREYPPAKIVFSIEGVIRDYLLEKEEN